MAGPATEPAQFSEARRSVSAWSPSNTTTIFLPGVAEAGSCAAGTRHGIGNVVIFQVQENRQTHFHKRPYAARTVRAEEFQSQLQTADGAAQLRRQLARMSEIGCI